MVTRGRFSNAPLLTTSGKGAPESRAAGVVLREGAMSTEGMLGGVELFKLVVSSAEVFCASPDHGNDERAPVSFSKPRSCVTWNRF
jgi:hypothetical protein